MGRRAPVQRLRGSDHEPIPCTADMVRIHLNSDSHELRRVDRHRCPHTAEGFGKDNRRATVQQSIGLIGAVINGHARTKKVAANFNSLNAQVLSHGTGAKARKVIEIQ